jgi:chemotaxis signal transduction protein
MEQMETAPVHKGLLAKINALLKQQPKEEELQSDDRHYVKLLIFHINDKKYAFYADLVSEIINTETIFFVPFIPDYIRGFINCHGEPYTVFDINSLLDKKVLDAHIFIIINDESDKTAFLISDIVEIVKWPEQEINFFTSHDGASTYFTGAINLDGAVIFIINLNSLLERLKNDIGAL